MADEIEVDEVPVEETVVAEAPPAILNEEDALQHVLKTALTNDTLRRGLHE